MSIGLAIQLMSPDEPKLSDILQMIVDMVNYNERESSSRTPYGRDVIYGLCKVYVARCIELNEEKDKETVLVSEAEAEALWWKWVESGYRAGTRNEIPKEQEINRDAMPWWPDYLPYNGIYTPKLIKSMAEISGYISGIAAIQMRDWWKEHQHEFESEAAR